jgi:hypothetical protein
VDVGSLVAGADGVLEVSVVASVEGALVAVVGVLVAGVDGLVVIVGTSSASPSPDPHPVSARRVMRTVAVPKERMAPSFQLERPVARHHTGWRARTVSSAAGCAARTA